MRWALITVLLSVLTVASVRATSADSLENALKTAKGDQKVKTLNELFRVYINVDPVKAIGYTEEALNLATDIDDQKGMAASNNNLGVAYRNQGALDKALRYYLVSLKIYATLSNKDGIATTQNNIGTIYSLKKDYSQAMKYFELSHQTFTELGDQARIMGSLNNLGNLHSDLQLYDQALKYYTEALAISKKLNKVTSDPLNNIGNLYFRQGNYQKAIETYEKGLAMAKKENNNITVLNITANIGEVYARAGQNKKAQTFLEEALDMSRQMQALIYEPQILKSLSYNYSKMGDMKNAYLKMVQYDAIREKIYGEESSRKIAQMEMALDLHEREKEVEALKKEDIIKSLQLKNTRMVIATGVMAIILLVAIFNLFFSKRRVKGHA